MQQKRQALKQMSVFIGILSVLTTVIFMLMFKNISKDTYMAWGGLMMWVPAAAALITTFATKDKITNYGWKPGKFKHLAYSYLVPVIIGIIAYGTAWIFGLIDFYGDEAQNYKWLAVLGIEKPASVIAGIFSKLLVGTCVILILTLGEEIGWSGFLIPKLMTLTSLPMTALISGLIWAVWHYPAITGGIYGSGAPGWLTITGFTVVITGNSFFKAYYVTKSKSLWPGVFIHTGHNVVTMGILFDLTIKSKHAAWFVSENGIITAVVYLIAAILFWRIRARKQLKIA